MKTAREFWVEKFDEQPTTDSAKLSIAFASYYADLFRKDIEFLANRSLMASSVTFGEERDTGRSSNSIVAIAYGLIPLYEQCFPADESDMKSCENMWKKLPEHRKDRISFASKAMELARLYAENGFKKNK